MNTVLKTDEIYSHSDRAPTLEKLESLISQSSNVFVQFSDENIRAFPKEALREEFYQEITSQLQPYNHQIMLLRESKEIIGAKWRQNTSHIDRRISDLEQEASAYIGPWVDKSFPILTPTPKIDQRIMDYSIPHLRGEPEQTIHRYNPSSVDGETSYSIQIAS